VNPRRGSGGGREESRGEKDGLAHQRDSVRTWLGAEPPLAILTLSLRGKWGTFGKKCISRGEAAEEKLWLGNN